MTKLIEFINVSKYYEIGGQKILANNNLNFSINEGEFCVVVGPSGAGKTTVLNLLGGLETLDSGQIIVDNQNIGIYKEKELTNYRRNMVGFVFQFYNLMPNLTAVENIDIASEICQNPLSSVDVLQDVGLKERMSNFPSQLSGGEQQRVSIARALAKNTKILLCDEPTGALDYETGKSILRLLYNTSKQNSKTVVVITHNAAITKMADHVIYLKNGIVVKEEFNEAPIEIEKIEW